MISTDTTALIATVLADLPADEQTGLMVLTMTAYIGTAREAGMTEANIRISLRPVRDADQEGGGDATTGVVSMSATDPVALLAAALAGLDPEAQADVLEDMLQAHVQACHRTAPDMPLEEIHRLFSLLARAALALLDETAKATAPQPPRH